MVSFVNDQRVQNKLFQMYLQCCSEKKKRIQIFQQYRPDMDIMTKKENEENRIGGESKVDQVLKAGAVFSGTTSIIIAESSVAMYGLGFSAGVPVGGSITAGMQANIGPAVAGSTFSVLKSVGMVGVIITVGLSAVAVGAIGSAIYSQQSESEINKNLILQKHINTYYISTHLSEILSRNIEKVVQILDSQNIRIQQDDMTDQLSEMRNKLFEMEHQNTTLRNQKLDLTQEVEAANQQISNLLPKYKEQIDKLQNQLKHGAQQQEHQYQDEFFIKHRQFEQKLESQMNDLQFSKSIKKTSTSKQYSDKKNKSDKKIKQEIKQLDDDIVKLQKSLESEIGKVGKL